MLRFLSDLEVCKYLSLLLASFDERKDMLSFFFLKKRDSVFPDSLSCTIFYLASSQNLRFCGAPNSDKNNFFSTGFANSHVRPWPLFASVCAVIYVEVMDLR